MHYAEVSDHLDSKVDDPREPLDSFMIELAEALREGQGYVAIVLDPDGLKIAPVHIEGSSQMTIRAKSTLRKIAHEVQIHSGASKSS